MNKLNRNDLFLIKGGNLNFLTGALINGITKLIEVIYDVGKGLGSSISKIKNNRYC